MVCDTPRTNVSNSNCQSDIEHPEHNLPDNSIPQKRFLTTLTAEAVDKTRANSFLNWPLITPNAKDMIIAGWLYTNIADRVMCIYCNALYHKWSETDRPYDIHRLKSPQCPFVLSTEKNVVNTPATNITITTEPNTEAAVEPANSNFALACRRYETFQKWPHTEENPLPSIESFVEAGFYYTGDKTIVRCFYCNGALRNWQVTDDPKVEHARWHPHCAYIRQYIGEDLYQAIQRKNRELKGM
jgi:hypothetical protein